MDLSITCYIFTLLEPEYPSGFLKLEPCPSYVAPPSAYIFSQNNYVNYIVYFKIWRRLISLRSTIPMTTPFEGPEKLLEIWFAPSASAVPDACKTSKCGLKKVDRSVWEEMLSIVKCKVLSVIEGVEVDAYLLRCS
jgi:hypothetical protein